MTAHFLKLIRLSTIVGILYLFFTNLFSIFRTQRPIPTIIFTDVFIISIITIITSYALIDTATLASVARLNIGSFTVSLRRDVVKPLILYDDEWNADCLRVREALSSLGIPVLIYPVPKLSSNPQYFNNYPIESRYIADAIMHHPQLEFTLPLLYDPNTGAVLFGDGEKINNYIYSYYSKRLTDVDPPPPLTIGPLDLITSKVSIFLRYGSRDGPIARPSIYNKSPLHLYGNQADGGSRIVREWLCRLQLSYLLFPTSRGSMYRAVLTHQVGSFYYSQRSKLIYERFNILVSYEHQRKEILEGLKDVHSRDGNGNDWNLNLDRFGLIDRKYPHNNRHHRYKKRDQDDIDMDISPDLFFANQDDERMIDFEMANKQRDPLPTAQSLQESVILKDPKTNQFTIVQNHGKKQTEMDGFEFGQKLQKYGYYDEVKSPNQSNAFNNVSGTHVNLINPRQDGVRVRSNTLSSKLGSKNGQPEGANDDNILMLDRIIQDAERRNNEQLEKAQEFASASPLQQPQQSQQPQPQQPQPQPQQPQPQPQQQQHSSTLARNTPKQQPQQISKPFHYPQHNPDPNSNKSLSYLPPTNPPLTPLFASGPKNNSQYQDSLRDESLLKIMKPVQPQDGNQITEYQYVLDNDNLKSSNRKGYLGDNSPDSHSSSYPTAHTHKTTPNQLIDDSDPLPDLQTVPLGLFESQPPQDQKISSTHISPYSDDGPIPGLSLMPSLLQPNPSLGSNMSHVHCLPNDNYGDVKKGPVGRHYGSDRHNLCGKNPPSNPVSPRSGQSGNSPLPKQKEEILQSESPAEPNVDERLLMTSLSTFQRSVGLVMLYDPNTEITAFGTDAAVRYIKLMYSFDTSGYQGNDALGSMLLSPLQNGTM